MVIRLLPAIALLAAGCSYLPGTMAYREAEARDALIPGLNDGESARFNGLRDAKAGGVCGYINAKNGFGAYVGFRRFIATDNIIAVEPHIVEDDRETRLVHREFREAWRTEGC